MASSWNSRDSVELERLRRSLIERAALERLALQGATEDLQAASDRIVGIAVTVVTLVRRYWLPVGMIAAASLFKPLRPALRLAQTGLAIWQVARQLRGLRR